MNRFFLSLLLISLLVGAAKSFPPVTIPKKEPVHPLSVYSEYPVLPKEIQYGSVSQRGELIEIVGDHWRAHGEWYKKDQRNKEKFILIIYWYSIDWSSSEYYSSVSSSDKEKDLWVGRYCRLEEDTEVKDGVLIGSCLGHDTLLPKKKENP
jgi:hypothetical protein